MTFLLQNIFFWQLYHAWKENLHVGTEVDASNVKTGVTENRTAPTEVMRKLVVSRVAFTGDKRKKFPSANIINLRKELIAII